MTWIYLSPHLDDAVFSCGGLIWQQSQAGERVEIWTLCAGDPPDTVFSPFAQELHARWGAAPELAVENRRQEDLAACRAVGAYARHFSLPDCIYRRPGMNYWQENASIAQMDAPYFLYPDRDAIFGALHPLEWSLVDASVAFLSAQLPADSHVVAPLTLGGHVDHRLVRWIAERLSPALSYYADYPYAAGNFSGSSIIAGVAAEGGLGEVGSRLPPCWHKQTYPLPAAALSAWMDGVGVYRSQISSFWPDLDTARLALEAYSQDLGGAALWSP
jgi:LmbE family N-acetylglucosaminyl deacetylase